jgi:transcriptional regulatory protein LevR
MDNKEAAKQLYCDGWDQSRIASALGVAQKTITAWKQKGNWDKDRIKATVIAQESTERVWGLIDYQTKALNQQIKNYQEQYDANGGVLPLIDKGHLDALQKLFTIVKTKEQKFLDVVKTVTALLEYVQSKDLKLAQASHQYYTNFIEESRNRYE